MGNLGRNWMDELVENPGEVPKDKATGYQGPLQGNQPVYPTQNVILSEQTVVILGFPGIKPSAPEYQPPVDAGDLMEPLS